MVFEAVKAVAPSTSVRGDGKTTQPTAEDAQFAVGLPTISGGLALVAATGRPLTPLPPDAIDASGTKPGSARRPVEVMPHPAGVGGGGGGAGGPKSRTSTTGESAENTVAPSAEVRSAGVRDVSVLTLAAAAAVSATNILALTVKAAWSLRRATDAATVRVISLLATPSMDARPIVYAVELNSAPTVVSKMTVVL